MRHFVLSLVLLLSTSIAAAEISNIAAAPEKVSPLLPGLTAPQLTLRDKAGKNVDLASLYKQKLTVLVVGITPLEEM